MQVVNGFHLHDVPWLSCKCAETLRQQCFLWLPQCNYAALPMRTPPLPRRSEDDIGSVASKGELVATPHKGNSLRRTVGDARAGCWRLATPGAPRRGFWARFRPWSSLCASTHSETKKKHVPTSPCGGQCVAMETAAY